MKTISIPEDLHKSLTDLKLISRDRNMAEIIRKLILAYKEQKFLENSIKFRQMLKKSGKSFAEFLKEARKIREEIADEQRPDK